MTPSLNHTLSAQIVSCELRGAYRFAWVQDAVVRQWIRCPMSLSCEAHRPPLWTADINLLRQRCGGVWLSSHTTTHISTRRHTQTRPYAYSLRNSRQRGCSVRSWAVCATIKIWFFFCTRFAQYSAAAKLVVTAVDISCHHQMSSPSTKEA